MMLSIFQLLFILPYFISASKQQDKIPQHKFQQYLNVINEIDPLLVDDSRNAEIAENGNYKNNKYSDKNRYKAEHYKNLEELPLNQLFVDCSDTLVLAKDRLQSLKEKYTELVEVITQVTKENEILKRKLENLGETKESIEELSDENYRGYSFGDGYLKHICAEYDKELHHCAKNITRQRKQILYLKGNLTVCEVNFTNTNTEKLNCNTELQACKIISSESTSIINKLNIENTEYKTNISKSMITINECTTDLSTCKSNSLTNKNLLNTCNINLEDCIKNATNAANSGTSNSENLKICQANLHEANALLSTCNNDLNNCKNNATSLVYDFNTCSSYLLACKHNITTSSNVLKHCKLDLNECKANGYDVSLMKNNYQQCKENNTILNTNLNICNNNLDLCSSNVTYNLEILKTCNLDLKICKDDSKTVINDKKRLQELLDICQPSVTDLQTSLEKYSILVDKLNSTCRSAVKGLALERSPDGGLYYFFNSTRRMKTWFGAQDFCRLKGMELVSIESAEENEWLKKRSTAILNNEGHHVKPSIMWTGLHNLENHHNWVWSGTGQNATFKGWPDKEPHTAHTDRCVNLHWRYSEVKWDNMDCLTRARFICEVVKPCTFVL